MSNTVNFGDVPDNEFEALPEDRYSVECVDAKLAESKAGKPKITAQFKVLEGDYENRRLFNDFSLVPKALFNLKNYFVAAGLDMEGEIDFDDIPEMMKDTQLTVYVTQEEYNGKAQNRLGNFAAIGADGESMFS